MGEFTSIEWCDSTVNPTENCSGCELWIPGKNVRICYAGAMTERYKGKGAFDQPVALKPGRMAQAARWSDLRGTRRSDKPWIPTTTPRLIFISDMSDALCSEVPFGYFRDQIIGVVSAQPGSRHNWIWVTKRPARMAEFSHWLRNQGIAWPQNLWALTSVTDQEKAQSRIPALLEVGDENTVRGISAEPILGPIRLQSIVAPALRRLDGRGLDWIIVGGVSGRNADSETFSYILRLAVESGEFGIPCFLKQMGRGPAWKDLKGGDWNEWPERFRIRQFPNKTPNSKPL